MHTPSISNVTYPSHVQFTAIIGEGPGFGIPFWRRTQIVRMLGFVLGFAPDAPRRAGLGRSGKVLHAQTARGRLGQTQVGKKTPLMGD